MRSQTVPHSKTAANHPVQGEGQWQVQTSAKGDERRVKQKKSSPKGSTTFLCSLNILKPSRKLNPPLPSLSNLLKSDSNAEGTKRPCDWEARGVRLFNLGVGEQERHLASLSYTPESEPCLARWMFLV